MNHIRWFRLPLAAIAVSWLGGAWGATQRYLDSEAGTVCIAAGRLKQGVYTILDAPQATNPEAVDAWTLDNQSSRNITLRRSGTTLEAVVSGSGLEIIFR